MMLLGLAIIAIILIVAGVRGQIDKVGEILQDDFTGNTNFAGWLVAVAIVGTVASFKQTRQLGQAFYALMIVVLLLSNQGFIREFERQALR